MLTPYPFQLDAIERGVSSNVIIADECGLGKTLVAIEIIRRRIAFGGDGEPSMVVAPLRVIGQWQQMVAMQELGLECVCINTGSRIDLRSLMDCSVLVLIHYEALVKHGMKLCKIRYNTIVCDEAHRIKNRKAIRTTHVKMLRASRFVGLTGTPMDRPDEVWSLLNWLDPFSFRSYWKFVDRFCVQESTPYGYKKISGAKNEKEFALEISKYMIRRRKVDVAPQLPPKIITRVPLELSPAVRSVYNRIRRSKDFVIDLDDDIAIVIKNAGALMSLLHMLTSDPSCLDLEGYESVKLGYIIDFMDDNPDEIVVVFTKYRVSAMNAAYKLGCPLVMGGEDNDEAIRKFTSGESNAIVGTIAAMAEGVNLQRATTAFFLDVDWSTSSMTQAIDRVHRIDITDPKNIYFLYVRNTVDEYVFGVMDGKMSRNEAILKWVSEEYNNGR